jgi:hypothetical protein
MRPNGLRKSKKHLEICLRFKFSIYFRLNILRFLKKVNMTVQVPHLSTEVVSVVERRQNPYSIYLAPSREDITQAQTPLYSHMPPTFLSKALSLMFIFVLCSIECDYV